MDVEILFRCPICKEIYESRALAERCLQQGPGDVPRGLSVGDLVWCRTAHGLLGLDYPVEAKPWTMGAPGFTNEESRHPIFIVTAITGAFDNPHQRIVHVASAAVDDGRPLWSANARFLTLPASAYVLPGSDQYLGRMAEEGDRFPW